MSLRRYWIVNSGTTQQPWSGQLRDLYRAWNDDEGNVQGFSRRPSSIAVGDVLLHRAVGSDGNRIVAVGEVTAPPIDVGRGRWPWRLPRRLVAVCATLDAAPRAEDVGLEPRGVRTYKEVPASIGAAAARVVMTAGPPLES